MRTLHYAFGNKIIFQHLLSELRRAHIRTARISKHLQIIAFSQNILAIVLKFLILSTMALIRASTELFFTLTIVP